MKYNGDNNIVYAISFAQWENESKGIVDFAQDVYAFNTPAAAEIVVSDYEKAVTQAEDALVANPISESDLREALKLLEELDEETLSNEQNAYVDSLIGRINEALKPFDQADDLAAAKEAAVKALKDYAALTAANCNVTVADIQDALDDQIAAVNADSCDTIEKVKAIIDYTLESQAGQKTSGVKALDAAAIAARDEKASIATVSTADELSAAIANSSIKTIELADDIALSSQTAIPAGVTLDGNGYTITSSEMNKSHSAIVLSTGSTLKNVTVESFATAAGWNGNYGVQAYNATGVTIEDVTVVGFDAGIMVNASEVSLVGTIDVSGNEFGGIEVSKGAAAGLSNAELTIEEGTTLVHAESGEVATVWVCYGKEDSQSAQGTVVDNAGVLGRPEFITKENKDVELHYALA